MEEDHDYDENDYVMMIIMLGIVCMADVQEP